MELDSIVVLLSAIGIDVYLFWMHFRIMKIIRQYDEMKANADGVIQRTELKVEHLVKRADLTFNRINTMITTGNDRLGELKQIQVKANMLMDPQILATIGKMAVIDTLMWLGGSGLKEVGEKKEDLAQVQGMMNMAGMGLESAGNKIAKGTGFNDILANFTGDAGPGGMSKGQMIKIGAKMMGIDLNEILGSTIGDVVEKKGPGAVQY